MFRTRAVMLVVLLVLVSACHPADKYQDQFWVISDSASIYERPTITSKTLKELKFGRGGVLPGEESQLHDREGMGPGRVRRCARVHGTEDDCRQGRV